MKILIAAGIWKPELGGPPTFGTELAKRLVAAGHSVAVLTYSPKGVINATDEASFPVVRVERHTNKLSNYWRYFWSIRALLKKEKPDVVYMLDWFTAGVPATLACKLAGQPYVVRVGGGYIWERYLNQGKPPMPLAEFYERGLHKKYPVMYRLIKWVLSGARTVIFNSDQQRLLYQKHYRLVPEKTTTIYNAVPHLEPWTGPKQAKEKEIVFVGRFVGMKNVSSLVRAFARLSDAAFKLVLIGEGPEEPKLRRLVQELGIAARAQFLSPLPRGDFERIRNSYLIVIPSWTDVSPHQVYELLALGLPFLLTTEHYLPLNSEDFLKIDPASVDDIAEKLNRLLDPGEYAKFMAQLRALKFTWTWDDAFAAHLRVFNQIH